VKRAVLDLALITLCWLLLLWGLAVHDWWPFATGAFLIPLDRIGPKK
jgi:hypothetical protein